MRRYIVSLLALVVISLSVTPALAQLTKVDFLLPAPKALPAFSYYTVAEQKGFYRDEGLEINFLTVRGGMDVVKQVGVGHTLIGHGIPGNAIIIRSQGVPVKIVALFGGHGLFFLISPKETGITDISHIKGRTVAVMSFVDGTYYDLLAAMASAGLKKEDANIQAFGPGGTPKSLIAGKAEAMSGVIEWGVEVEEAGKELNWIPLEKYAPVMGQALMTSDKVVQENPELIRRFLRATLRGFKFLMENPEEVARMYAQTYPIWKGKEKSLTTIFTRYVQWVYSGQRLLGEIPEERLVGQLDYYYNFGIIRSKFPIKELYTNDFVKAVAPEIK